MVPKLVVMVLNMGVAAEAAEIMVVPVENKEEVHCLQQGAVAEAHVLARVLEAVVDAGGLGLLATVPNQERAMTTHLVVVTAGVDKFWLLMALMVGHQAVAVAVELIMVVREQAVRVEEVK